MTRPTVPEKKPIARARSDGFGTTAESDAMRSAGHGAHALAGRKLQRLRSAARGCARDRRSALPDLRSCALLADLVGDVFWAPMNDFRAGIAPEPFVDLTHAPPSSYQTLAICGMFGIGTPPVDAAPNSFRSVSLTCAGASVLAG